MLLPCKSPLKRKRQGAQSNYPTTLVTLSFNVHLNVRAQLYNALIYPSSHGLWLCNLVYSQNYLQRLRGSIFLSKPLFEAKKYVSFK
jgi:hypothetical protein